MHRKNQRPAKRKGLAMPYKGERPLLMRIVISLPYGIFTYLRASLLLLP